MDVSFIIPAHNEESHIAACLQAIDEAMQPLGYYYETVVVADACWDRTAARAERAGARVETVALRHIAATRNAGAAVATGRWLFFVDADTRVASAIVKAACQRLEQGQEGGGGLIRFDRPVPLYGRLLEPLFWAIGLLLQYSGGCFLFCRREVFERIGGFDTSLYAGEELAFAAAIKKIGRFRVLPHSVVTSARKVRQYRLSELLGLVRMVLREGRPALTRRENLDLWYRRRPDPA